MLLFYVKAIMRESRNFEVAHLKKKTGKQFCQLVAIWLVLSLFVPLGVLLVMKTLEDEWYVVIKAYFGRVVVLS